MGKVNSWWWKDGPSKDFHAKNKPLLSKVVQGYEDFNILAQMVVHKSWTTMEGEKLTPSMNIFRKMRDDYIRAMPRLLKGCGWINRLAIHKMVDFLYVLHKSDDMYYERIGYLMWLAIEMGPAWIASDHNGRIAMLHTMRETYMANEHRDDRMLQITAGWNWIEDHYANDAAITNSLDFVIEQLQVYKAEFNRDEVSRLGIKAFYPEHWYPVGRGQMWDLVHGGMG